MVFTGDLRGPKTLSTAPDAKMTIKDWLDDGVRVLVTLAFAGGLVYGFLHGEIAPDVFVGLAGLALGFWFNGKGNGVAK